MSQEDFLTWDLGFCSFVRGLKNIPVITYIIRTTKIGLVGAVPFETGSTIGFVITSGNAEKAAERTAAANPIVVEILIFVNFEKTVLRFPKYNVVDIVLWHHF